jgi:ribosome-associated translation inhibitor RaiA
MKILFHDKKRLLNTTAVQMAESKVASALSKFGDRIQSIEIQIDDSNGPRGGRNKECRATVRIRSLGDVVASATDERVSNAVALAVGRIERAVARRINRRFLISNPKRWNGVQSA